MKRVLPWLGWLALLALTVLWRLKNIDAFGLNNDEGAYLMWARLVSEGYALYSQTYTGAPPLFTEMLALIFRVFGFDILLGRLVVLFHFAALIGLLSILSHRIAGWAGAYAALLIAAVLPPMFNFSRQVMLEIPAMTFAAAAVLCAYIFWEIEERERPKVEIRSRKSLISLSPISLSPISIGDGLLILAGIFIGGSLLVKFLHPLAAAPILIFIWFGSDAFKERFWRTVLFGLAAAGTIAVAFLFFDLDALLDQVFRFRMETRAALPMLLPSNWQRFTAYFGQIWGLGLLALAGIALSGRRVRGLAWTLWLAVNFVLLMWYDPLFPHHFTIILPPLILLAVEFIGCLARAPKIENQQSKIYPAPGRRVQNSLAWGLLLLAFFNLPAMLKANQALASITTGGREAEAARILNQVTRPTDFVMSDSQLLALMADRLTPPPLVDFSLVYIQSGRQTPERLMALSREYLVSAAASWSLRMAWLPEYLDWAAENFWVKKVWDNDHILYFGPKHPPGQPIPNEQAIHFEGGISLVGYSIDRGTRSGAQADKGTRASEQGEEAIVPSPRPLAPSSSLPVTLYWQTDRPLATDYTIFVQLIGSEGQLAAQNDSQPVYGYFPTSQWPAGEVISDRITIPLPADLAPGEYTLIAGLYDGATLARLPLREETGDYIVLGAVTVE